MAVDFPAPPLPAKPTPKLASLGRSTASSGSRRAPGRAIYLPLAGGVMTGDITLKGDPTAALQPVTKQMLDAGFNARALAMNDNRIINGDMRIDQRNGGASGTANSSYTVDRWALCATQATSERGSEMRQQRYRLPAGSHTACWLLSRSALHAARREIIFSSPKLIEADMVSDFAVGNGARAARHAVVLGVLEHRRERSAGRSATTQARAPIHSVFRSLTADVWTKIIITIPGDTGGTWVMSGQCGRRCMCVSILARARLIAVQRARGRAPTTSARTEAQSVAHQRRELFA